MQTIMTSNRSVVAKDWGEEYGKGQLDDKG